MTASFAHDGASKSCSATIRAQLLSTGLVGRRADAAVERRRVVGVVVRVRAVGDDEAVPQVVRPVASPGSVSCQKSHVSVCERRRRSRRRRRAAFDMLHDLLPVPLDAVEADAGAGDVVGERAEAERDRRPVLDGAAGRPVQRARGSRGGGRPTRRCCRGRGRARIVRVFVADTKLNRTRAPSTGTVNGMFAPPGAPLAP